MTLETGTIPLSDTTTLAPGLDEESFRATDAFAAATPFVHNGPYRSYRLAPIALENDTMLPIVFFDHGRLGRISLHRAPARNLTWNTLDTAAESRWAETLRRRIELRLNRTLPASFPWGRLSVAFDPRAGTAALTLDYAPPAQSGPRSDDIT